MSVKQLHESKINFILGKSAADEAERVDRRHRTQGRERREGVQVKIFRSQGDRSGELMRLK